MKLSESDIRNRLASLPGWTFAKDAVAREFVFPSFPDAIAFVARLAFTAEAADHHPDLHVSYKRVGVTWTTHSEGGVTEKDLRGAQQSSDLAKKFGA
jgi:4a-hydroxytetrahydrobiopterin dehydratase